MQVPATAIARLRVGEFEVDLRCGEVRRNGDKIKLQQRPFQIFAALLQRPGEVVTREEIRQSLWPTDTFVDFEHSINTAVNKLREALGDDVENPRFIETLPRYGYRFIGELEPSVESVAPVEPDRGSSSHHRRKIAAGVAVIAAVGAGVANRWSRQQRPPEKAAVLSAFPFTAFPGEETAPAFSPDGSRIAFAWNGDPGPGPKVSIYT
jgi:DNA-binding winged helix-turn-helix (wHTH) protein